MAVSAGLRAEDILIDIDGKPIQNLSDFSYALQDNSPDDEVSVVVLRGEE